jgi:hypothetical protein
MKWFQDPPKRPEMPEHVWESACQRWREKTGIRGTPGLTDEMVAQYVEHRLRAEAAEYVRQVEQWKAQRDEYARTQPYDICESRSRVRMFDGPWIGYSHAVYDMFSAYRTLADAGADEATLRREAAIVYELDRMRQVLDAKERDAADRMRAEAEKLGPAKKAEPQRLITPEDMLAAIRAHVAEHQRWATGLWATMDDEPAPREPQPAPADERHPVGTVLHVVTLRAIGGQFRMTGPEEADHYVRGDEKWIDNGYSTVRRIS